VPLSTGREREEERNKRKRERERERERERANKPLRRAFSRSVVKGKGAIAESLPCRVVSIQQSEEEERERKRINGIGGWIPRREKSRIFF